MGKIFAFLVKVLSLPINSIFYTLNIFPSSCYVGDQIRRKETRGSSWISFNQKLRYGDYLKAKFKSLVTYDWQNRLEDKPCNFIYREDFEKYIRE